MRPDRYSAIASSYDVILVVADVDETYKTAHQGGHGGGFYDKGDSQHDQTNGCDVKGSVLKSPPDCRTSTREVELATPPFAKEISRLHAKSNPGKVPVRQNCLLLRAMLWCMQLLLTSRVGYSRLPTPGAVS